MPLNKVYRFRYLNFSIYVLNQTNNVYSIRNMGKLSGSWVGENREKGHTKKSTGSGWNCWCLWGLLSPKPNCTRSAQLFLPQGWWWEFS